MKNFKKTKKLIKNKEKTKENHKGAEKGGLN